MVSLSPRFLALPLIAVAVILALPRGPHEAGKEIAAAPQVHEITDAQVIAECVATKRNPDCAVTYADNATATAVR